MRALNNLTVYKEIFIKFFKRGLSQKKFLTRRNSFAYVVIEHTLSNENRKLFSEIECMQLIEVWYIFILREITKIWVGCCLLVDINMKIAT